MARPAPPLPAHRRANDRTRHSRRARHHHRPGRHRRTAPPTARAHRRSRATRHQAYDTARLLTTIPAPGQPDPYAEPYTPATRPEPIIDLDQLAKKPFQTRPEAPEPLHPIGHPRKDQPYCGPCPSRSISPDPTPPRPSPRRPPRPRPPSRSPHPSAPCCERSTTTSGHASRTPNTASNTCARYRFRMRRGILLPVHQEPDHRAVARVDSDRPISGRKREVGTERPSAARCFDHLYTAGEVVDSLSEQARTQALTWWRTYPEDTRYLPALARNPRAAGRPGRRTAWPVAIRARRQPDRPNDTRISPELPRLRALPGERSSRGLTRPAGARWRWLGSGRRCRPSRGGATPSGIGSPQGRPAEEPGRRPGL